MKEDGVVDFWVILQAFSHRFFFFHSLLGNPWDMGKRIITSITENYRRTGAKFRSPAKGHAGRCH